MWKKKLEETAILTKWQYIPSEVLVCLQRNSAFLLPDSVLYYCKHVPMCLFSFKEQYQSFSQ